MKNLSRNLLWILLIFISVSLIFSLIAEVNNSETEEFGMSEIAKKVEAGEVESIIVSGEELEIILKNGTEATSRKEAETGLTETLKNYGVSAGALQEVNISFKDESGFKHWAGILIPTLLPLLIIILVFWWIFRRARGGVNQAFTFGKANLKISIPSKTKDYFQRRCRLERSQRRTGGSC